MTLTYAGIESHATPRAVLDHMTAMATWLARKGWHLHSGGAPGTDTAFANGAPAEHRTLFLPWPGYNGCAGTDCARCLRTRSRNASPSRAPTIPRGTAVCQPPESSMRATPPSVRTRGGAVSGGTGMRVRIAYEHGVPVLNMAVLHPRTVC